MEDEFDILAAKVLAEEATAPERSRFARLLVEHPSQAQEFAGMQAAWDATRLNGHLSLSLDSPSAEIPAERLRELERVVRKMNVAPRKQRDVLRPHEPAGWLTSLCLWLRTTGLRPATLSLALLGLAVGSFFVFQNISSEGSKDAVVAFIARAEGKFQVVRDGRSMTAAGGSALGSRDIIALEPGAEVILVQSQGVLQLTGPRRGRIGDLLSIDGDATAHSGSSNLLHRALFSPVRQVSLLGVVGRTRGAHAIHLYSPVGATADLTPTLLWNAVSGKRYDIVLTDEFDVQQPAFRLGSVQPPVDFGVAWKGRSLKSDGLYRVRISEAGNLLTSSESTFRTLKDAEAGELAPNGSVALMNAFRILKASPARAGDALAILLTLPEDLAKSELAQRLKLTAFALLGFEAEFDSTARELVADHPPL
jgi:hypothetical protein